MACVSLITRLPDSEMAAMSSLTSARSVLARSAVSATLATALSMSPRSAAIVWFTMETVSRICCSRSAMSKGSRP